MGVIAHASQQLLTSACHAYQLQALLISQQGHDRHVAIQPRSALEDPADEVISIHDHLSSKV